MKLHKNMLNNVAFVVETLYYLMNMNGVEFHVATALLNESLNSLKFNEKNKLHQFIKYGEHTIFCFCIEVYKTYEDDDSDKIFEA